MIILHGRCPDLIGAAPGSNIGKIRRRLGLNASVETPFARASLAQGGGTVRADDSVSASKSGSITTDTATRSTARPQAYSARGRPPPGMMLARPLGCCRDTWTLLAVASSRESACAHRSAATFEASRVEAGAMTTGLVGLPRAVERGVPRQPVPGQRPANGGCARLCGARVRRPRGLAAR